MIKVMAQIFFFYGLLPVLIGVVLSLVTKHNIHLPTVYALGYIMYLAILEIIVAWEMHSNSSFSQLTYKWQLTVYIITVSLCVITIIVFLANHRTHNNTKTSTSWFSINELHKSGIITREALIILGITLILTIVAILFLVPSPFDETPELARLALTSDTFFSTNPLTGKPYADGSSYPGSLYMLYACASKMTGIDATVMVHLITPIFMIPFFVCIYVVIAHLLFHDKEKRSERFSFILLVFLFYTLMLPLEAHVALAPYRNIWNGITLAGSCLFPLLFAICLDLTRHFNPSVSGKSITPALSLTDSFAGIIIVSLAIKLCVPFGLVVSGVFVVSTCVIILYCLLKNCKHNKRTSRHVDRCSIEEVDTYDD